MHFKQNKKRRRKKLLSVPPLFFTLRLTQLDFLDFFHLNKIKKNIKICLRFLNKKNNYYQAIIEKLLRLLLNSKNGPNSINSSPQELKAGRSF